MLYYNLFIHINDDHALLRERQYFLQKLQDSIARLGYILLLSDTTCIDLRARHISSRKRKEKFAPRPSGTVHFTAITSDINRIISKIHKY